MRNVYLAGPITGVQAGPQFDWRRTIMRVLLRKFDDVRCVNPLRGIPFDDDEIMIADTVARAEHTTTAHALIQRCYADVMHAHIVVANFLHAERASIGSCFEMAWCYTEHIPLVVIMQPENVHAHPFVRMAAGWIVPTLALATDVVVTHLEK